MADKESIYNETLDGTAVYVHVHQPLDVDLLNVPMNGGYCVKLICRDTIIFLKGYGLDAAQEAQRLAGALIKTARWIRDQQGGG